VLVTALRTPRVTEGGGGGGVSRERLRKVQSLLKSDDLDTVYQGIALVRSLGEPALYGTLLKGTRLVDGHTVKKLRLSTLTLGKSLRGQKRFRNLQIGAALADEASIRCGTCHGSVVVPPEDEVRVLGDGLEQLQVITRHCTREGRIVRIPLRDYGDVESLTENTMGNSLASDVGETQYDHHSYASVSSTGIAVDGVVIYPSYNNTLSFAQSAGELSAHGMHSGRGLGVHDHSDSHSSAGNGLHLYNATDYIGRSHPPVISMGYDGVAGYGVYADGDTDSDGATISLDDFAGHEHGSYGYHYHSVAGSEASALGVSYTTHMIPPRGAWSGRINEVPGFWESTNGRSVWSGTE
jgi:hypothetical protein